MLKRNEAANVVKTWGTWKWGLTWPMGLTPRVCRGDWREMQRENFGPYVSDWSLFRVQQGRFGVIHPQ